MKEKEHLCLLSSQKVPTMESAEKDLQNATASQECFSHRNGRGAADFRAWLSTPYSGPLAIRQRFFPEHYQLSTWNERLCEAMRDHGCSLYCKSWERQELLRVVGRPAPAVWECLLGEGGAGKGR